MEPLLLLANLLLSVTVATLVVSLLAYIAYKIREKRRPSVSTIHAHSEDEEAPLFLHLYVPSTEVPNHDRITDDK